MKLYIIIVIRLAKSLIVPCSDDTIQWFETIDCLSLEFCVSSLTVLTPSQM